MRAHARARRGSYARAHFRACAAVQRKICLASPPGLARAPIDLIPCTSASHTRPTSLVGTALCCRTTSRSRSNAVEHRTMRLSLITSETLLVIARIQQRRRVPVPSSQSHALSRGPSALASMFFEGPQRGPLVIPARTLPNEEAA